MHDEVVDAEFDQPVAAQGAQRALDLANPDDEDVARQACEAAGYLRQRGDPHASHDMIAPLYRAWGDRLGPTARPTLWAAKHLAVALGDLGWWREAVALERELHDHYVATYGDDHPDTLIAANNLAIDLAELGEYERAGALAEDTLARRRRVLGEDHPATMDSAYYFTRVLALLGEHERARTLAEEVLTRARRVLGNDHPDTLAAAYNLARRLADLGEYERARALTEDTLTRHRQVFGADDDPDPQEFVELLQWLEEQADTGS